jgi:hypothetical protein
MNWTCPFCETQNEATALHCEVCDAEKPAAPLLREGLKASLTPKWRVNRVKPTIEQVVQTQWVKEEMPLGAWLSRVIFGTKANLGITFLGVVSLIALVGTFVFTLGGKLWAGPWVFLVTLLLVLGIYSIRFIYLKRNSKVLVSHREPKPMEGRSLPSDSISVTRGMSRLFLGARTGEIAEWDLGSVSFFNPFLRTDAKSQLLRMAGPYVVAIPISNGKPQLMVYDNLPDGKVIWQRQLTKPCKPADLAVSLSGYHMAVFSREGILFNVPLAGGNVRHAFLRAKQKKVEKLSLLCISDDGEKVACLLPDGRIDLRMKSSFGRGERFLLTTGEPTHMAFVGLTQALMMATPDGTLWVKWDLAPFPLLKFKHPIQALCGKHANQTVALASNGVLYLLHMADRKVSRIGKSAFAEVKGIALVNDHQLVVAGEGNHLEYWELVQKEGSGSTTPAFLSGNEFEFVDSFEPVLTDYHDFN